MSKAYVSFNDFMSLPVVFYHTIGVNPYESATNTATRGHWLLAIFIFHVVNLNCMCGLEVAFVYMSFRDSENFVESCMVMGYIAFVVVGELKMITVWWQKPKLNALMREMELIFPSSSVEDQRQYQVERYLQRCRMFTKGFTCLYLLLIATYNLYMLVQFFIQRFFLDMPNARLVMPYTPVSPWSLENGLGYGVMYILQALAGYCATAGHASSDILIYAVVIQDIMHYDFLSRELVDLQIQTGSVSDGSDKDLKLLQKLISYHNKLLGLTEVINQIFGLPLLLNFMASSLLVCFVGFQMTLGLSLEIKCKLAVFLVAQLVQIFLICYFSDLLINASAGVSNAVYEMNWIEADVRFKKMLLIVAARAQRPVNLRATVFLDVSMQTMTMFLQMTYRFFCMIRTMYQ